MKRYLLLLPFILGSALIFSPVANAQSEAVKEAREAVIESLENIKLLETETLSPKEYATKKLDLKTRCIGQDYNLINCSN